MIIHHKETELCNTPLNSQETSLSLHLDWLTIKTPMGNVSQCVEFCRYLDNYLGKKGSDIYVEDKGIRRGHDRKDYKVIGFESDWFLKGEWVNGDLTIWLSGSYFENLSLANQELLIRDLSAKEGVKITRIDLSIDDYVGIIPRREMINAYEMGNHLGFQKMSITESKGKFNDARMVTAYFGSRRSNSFTRIYDRYDPESKTYYMRQEVELKGNKAKEATRELINGVQFTKTIASLVLGQMDFVNRYKPNGEREKNLDRCKRLRFYQIYIDKVLNGCMPIKIKGEKIVRTPQKTLKWVNKQCVKTLVAMFKGLGTENFLQWLENCSEDVELDSHDHLLYWFLKQVYFGLESVF